MNPNLKKALLIFGGGLLLFWAFKKIRPIEVNTIDPNLQYEAILPLIKEF